MAEIDTLFRRIEALPSALENIDPEAKRRVWIHTTDCSEGFRRMQGSPIANQKIVQLAGNLLEDKNYPIWRGPTLIMDVSADGRKSLRLNLVAIEGNRCRTYSYSENGRRDGEIQEEIKPMAVDTFGLPTELPDQIDLIGTAGDILAEVDRFLRDPAYLVSYPQPIRRA